MRSTLFLVLCFLVYTAVVVFLIRKLSDITKNPAKYEAIPGYDKYRKSFWYEQGYERYGKHYYASLIVGIISLMTCVPGYVLLGICVQKFFLLPLDSFYLQSYQLYIGGIACIFFQIAFEFWLCFHSKAPICIACSMYAYSCMKRSKAWKKVTAFAMILCILCLPLMMISINAYSYADQEKIVTHEFLSLTETKIPYDAVVSAKTSYISKENGTQFDFSYIILLQDDKQIDIMEFGVKGATYLHTILQQRNIPITYGEIDAATYELMKQSCRERTLELVEEIFVIF